MAYGDQPALVAEMVDWARAAGFTVAAAGKGTKYLPLFHTVTPDDVWTHYGLTPEEAKAAGMNPQMFNSFLDGTKSAIEMAAIANACGLDGAGGRASASRPAAWTTSPTSCARASWAASSRARAWSRWCPRSSATAGRWPSDLRWGVYVVLKAPNDYAAACFKQYGLHTDATGRFAAMYKPFHLIGLELSISVLNAALRGEPTGATQAWRGDPVAVAKRTLKVGETLDGEGGYTVYGKVVPAARSHAEGALPIGLAHGVKLRREVPAGAIVREQDVTLDESCPRRARPAGDGARPSAHARESAAA